MTTISQLQAQITKLDNWTQLSVLGSWSFLVNAACINQAMRYVPNEPVDNGIEEFTQYEAARRALIKDADTSYLPAFIALQRELSGMVYDADGQSRGLEDTFQFLTDKGPKRSDFELDYDNRVRMGMKPGMLKRQFVEHEFARAVQQHQQLVAKGEHAIRLCDTITIADDRGYNDLPAWVVESFERKMLEKLHARWEKLELVRTNPRRQKQIRDAAAADQYLIEQTLHAYGQEPNISADEPDASESIADMRSNDLSQPTTVQRFRRAPAPAA